MKNNIFNFNKIDYIISLIIIINIITRSSIPEKPYLI